MTSVTLGEIVIRSLRVTTMRLLMRVGLILRIRRICARWRKFPPEAIFGRSGECQRSVGFVRTGNDTGKRRRVALFGGREEPARGCRGGPRAFIFLCSPRVVPGVIRRAHEVKRNVWLIADNPAVVAGCNVEEVSRFYFDNAAVGHCRDGFA